MSTCATARTRAGSAGAGSESKPRDIPEKVGLVLADGHPIVLQGMRHLFQAEADLDVLVCCTNDEETLEAVVRCEPIVLVLDLRLPRNGGLAVLRAVAQERIATRVVLLTASINESEMAEAIRLGVKGVVLKEMTPRLLVQCVRQVGRGATWFENGSVGAVVERMLRHETGMRELGRRLTPRELQVLRCVAGGLRNKEITARLDITEGTVKIHLHNIYEKLGMRDRLQLALRARDEGLV
jgi:DNA-binding NarL/FixJ family response regulator